MKNAAILTLFVWIFSTLSWASSSTALTLHLSTTNSDEANLSLIDQQIGNQEPTTLVFEFSQAKASNIFFSSTYSNEYPNGDFYYLIGDLAKNWSKSDYARFYNVARMLEAQGFRTIVNVAASANDVREAARNHQTSAIIWNSHGADDGSIFDIKDIEVPRDAFTKGKSARLRFVLFANCYGYRSIDYYHIGGQTLGAGWQGESDSEQFFSYLRSDDFQQDLKKAFGNSLKKK